MALTTRAYEIPRAEPVIITIDDEASTPAVSNTEEKDDCGCGLPPNASQQVHTARRISVMVIVIHAVSLFLGRVFWGQLLAALIAISTGFVVLCQFHRCAYSMAAVLYAISVILDILSVLFWTMNTEALAEDITDDDVDKDQAERAIRLLSLTPAVGAFCLFVGAIAATMAVCTWENSGAPDAAPVVESSFPVQSDRHFTRDLIIATKNHPSATQKVPKTPPERLSPIS